MIDSSAAWQGRPVSLRGITWDHTRGFLPMVATAQRFHELHPNVDVLWSRRSLQDFADQPLAEMARQFDLLVIDHPWVGFVASRGILLDIKECLPADFLADQAAHSVGFSHASYEFGGRHWALAIDAAAPVSACRSDLLQRAGAAPPQTWEDVIALGRKGLVCCPGIPLDAYCNFVDLCASAGADLFHSPEQVVNRAAGLAALERLKELASVVPAEFFGLNPIRTCEAMTQADTFAYCPFTYGYSNYARAGYARVPLKFGPVVTVVADQKPSTMLGGTGLAVSAGCQHPETALAYAQFVANPEIQRGLYFQAGGQPGHRSAWLDPGVNAALSNYFQDTLATLDAAFVRPRYDGYLHFQDRAGDPIQAFLREGGNPGAVLDALDKLYRASQSAA